MITFVHTFFFVKCNHISCLEKKKKIVWSIIIIELTTEIFFSFFLPFSLASVDWLSNNEAQTSWANSCSILNPICLQCIHQHVYFFMKTNHLFSVHDRHVLLPIRKYYFLMKYLSVAERVYLFPWKTSMMLPFVLMTFLYLNNENWQNDKS